MTDTLTIDRIVARTSGAEDVTDRVERIIRRVVEDRLDRMLPEYPVAGPGQWCVPSVNVAAVLDLERPDTALEEFIARAVLDAIADALRGSAAVHFPGPIDALAALIVAAGTHRFTDAWMWARMELVAGADELSRDPAACVLRALECHPESAVAAVVRAVGTGGFAAVHRLLTESGWIRLAGIVIDTGAGAGGGATRAALRAMLAHDAPPVEPVGDDRVVGGTTGPARAELLTASRVVTASHLAGAARGSRLRPPGPMLRALSVLAVAESEPAVLGRVAAVPVCRAVTGILSGAVSAITEIDARAADTRPRGRQPQAAAAPGTATAVPAVTGAQPADAEPAAAQADPAGGAETAWAGLLFLLNAATDAAMPQALLTDPVLDGVAAPELLARVAMAAAPVPADDPAVFAFAGADPRRTRCTWDTPLAEPLAERIDRHAAAWAAAVARRLDRTDEPAGCVADVALRAGTIEREPGWIDVHLDLAGVDIDVRRAGLDVDPGWVPWLGAVVRFCYG